MRGRRINHAQTPHPFFVIARLRQPSPTRGEGTITTAAQGDDAAIVLAMRVLAIDTALEACAAAVLDTERGTLASESLPMLRGHAEALMPLIARVMRQANIPFAALDRIGVTTGPGSFTGLRVGIAAARGIALAAGKPAFGLTTLSAFAAPHIAADETSGVTVAIDARHQHVYLQVFAAGGRTAVAPRIASVEDA